MCCLHTRSVATRAKFTGDWRIIYTVSRDSTLDVDSPLLGWAKYYPVEFRLVDQRLFDEYSYAGTGLQRHQYQTDADVLIYMDADTIVTGPLDRLVEEVAESNSVAGWPAWQPPPDFDFDIIFNELGLALPQQRMTYSGYGLSFMEPKYGPPYFNYGFIAMPNSLARKMGPTFEFDHHFLWTKHYNPYLSQIALGLNIVRNNFEFRELAMRYNCSNGDIRGPRTFINPEADAAFDTAVIEVAEHRVLHYCRETQDFSKLHDINNWENLRAFAAKTCIGDGGERMQSALVGLLNPPNMQ